MSMLILAALAAAQPAPVVPARPHAQHQPEMAMEGTDGMAKKGMDCACCKDMAKGSKMECCAKHGDSKAHAAAGEHKSH